MSVAAEMRNLLAVGDKVSAYDGLSHLGTRCEFERSARVLETHSPHFVGRASPALLCRLKPGLRRVGRRGGRVVEGTPLLRAQTVLNRLEGSNPFLSASPADSLGS